MILVTGGAGYIGSLVTRKLLELGEKVIVIDNLSSGSRENVDSRAVFAEVDILDKPALKSVYQSHKIDTTFHFAARIDLEESTQKPELYFEVNFEGTKNICDEMLSSGCRKIIFSSTAAVYSNLRISRVKESDETKPENAYGKSKLLAEDYIRQLELEKKISATIFRYFNVAGASDDLKIGPKYPKSLFKQLAMAAKNSRDFLIHGNDYETIDGTPVRDFIHLEDLAEVHSMAYMKMRQGNGGLYNVGYGSGYSVLQAVNTMKSISGKEFPVTMGLRRRGDLPSVISDCSQISKDYGWSPKYNDIRKICESAYNFELKLLSNRI